MSRAKHDAAGQPSAPIQLSVSTGAAYFDGSLSIAPCDWVKVSGPPGHTMSCSVAAGGEIIGLPDPKDESGFPSALYDGGLSSGISYGTGPYPPVLDENGFAWFLVRCSSDNARRALLELLEVTVTVFDQKDAANSAQQFPVFQDYTSANSNTNRNEHFVAYNYTTGAPADGATPCSLNLITDQKTTDPANVGHVQVTVSGSATVFGFSPTNHEASPKQYKIPLGADGCAAVQILDRTAETVTCTVVLLGVPGSDHLPSIAVDFV